MLLALIISTLITILVVVFGLIIYLVSVVFDESDDDGGASSLGIDTHDFITTPVSSPNGLPPADSHERNDAPVRQVGCNCTLKQKIDVTQASGKGERRATNKSALQSMVLADESLESLTGLETSYLTSELENATPEDIKSAELNSRLLKAIEQQREVGHERVDSADQKLESTAVPTPTMVSYSAESSASAATDGPAQIGLAPWPKSPTAQKNRITLQLGAAVAKQIFDELDPRDMQTGGTALHWCKTRPSLDKLVKCGIPLDLVNQRNETALHAAIRRHRLQVLIGLLVHGANIECRNELGETPLIVACKVRNIFAVQLILIFEANYDAVDKLGHSARHHISVICERNKAQHQQQPSAAHLILAMLNAIGAKRCPQRPIVSGATKIATDSCGSNNQGQCSTPSAEQQSTANSSAPLTQACPEGCLQSGIYNGNSYNRWPNFKRESLYKRHMFNDIIETKLSEARQHSRDKKQKADSVKTSRLLCIDGGGLRGVIVCQILIEMEKYLKRPMISYFDWIGGTSIGAFIACALCIGVPLKELRQICFDVKDEVFSGGRPYNSKFLEQVLRRTFGPSTRFSDIKDRKLAVTTVLADREPCQLRLFRNYQSPALMLEKYGYASDTFNNMSGHSVVSERLHSAKGHIQTKPKQVAKVVAASIASKKTPGATRDTATKLKEDEKKSLIDSTVTKKALVAGRGPSDDSSTSIRGLQQSRKGTNPKEIKEASKKPDDKDGGHKQASSNQSNLSVARSKTTRDIKLKTDKEESTGTVMSSIESADNQQEVILDENDPDPIIWQAVRASSAAPFFFKPYGPYLDGGIISNNPTLDMLNEFESYQKVRKFLRKHVKSCDTFDSEKKSFSFNSEAPSKLSLVVSLGTGRGRVIGRQAMIDFSQVASGFATVFSPIELVRSIRAARDFFKKLMQQSCHTDDYILDRAQAWCSSLDIPYFRLNPPLATIFSIDDKRDEQLINALWQTKLYMRAMKDQLNELSKLLDGPKQ